MNASLELLVGIASAGAWRPGRSPRRGGRRSSGHGRRVARTRATSGALYASAGQQAAEMMAQVVVLLSNAFHAFSGRHTVLCPPQLRTTPTFGRSESVT
jgi:hypothetical protein